MLAVALIVFREVLEAALIVGIVMAASRGVTRRGLWVAGGVGAGIVGAIIVAGFAEAIAEAASGLGQELFNAIILLAAVGLLGWHNVWMGRHGREIAAEMNQIGRAVALGTRPLHVLGAVVAVAVLREGSEVVLFLYGLASTIEGGWVTMLAGGVLGVIGGAALGLALYYGLLKIPTRHLFTVTSWLILLLAAGMASQAAQFLVQADLLPTLGDELWDTSWLLSETSVVGRVLHVLIGYTAQPYGIQALFYAATIIVIGGLMRMMAERRPMRARGRAA
jgi:high-affinity iron transporter